MENTPTDIEERKERILRQQARRKLFIRALYIGLVVCFCGLLAAYYNSRDFLITRKLTAEGEYIKGVIIEKWTHGSNPVKHSVKYHYVIDNKRYIQKSQVFAGEYANLDEGDSCVVWYARTKPQVSCAQMID